MKNNLLPRILALAKRANDAKNQSDLQFKQSMAAAGKGEPYHYDWETRQKAENEMYAEMDAIDKAAGPGLAVGRAIHFGVADGNACYIITKIRKNDVVVEWIPLCDNYFSDAVGLSADKRNYIVNRHTAERHVGFADAFSRR